MQKSCGQPDLIAVKKERKRERESNWLVVCVDLLLLPYVAFESTLLLWVYSNEVDFFTTLCYKTG